MKNTSIIVAFVLIIIVAVGGFWLYSGVANPPISDTATTTPSGKISADTASAVSTSVAQFGSKLKNVSLLAPSAALKTSMDENYAAFLSPGLLAEWEANPQLALGRHTSSPWPDRIDVLTISPRGDGTFEVKANVVEVTSATSTPASSYPITLTLQKSGDTYVITAIEK